MPQSGLDADSLCERLTSLLSTPALLGRAASCAHAAARLNAAKDLADLVCGLDNGNGDRLRPLGSDGSGSKNKTEAAA